MYKILVVLDPIVLDYRGHTDMVTEVLFKVALWNQSNAGTMEVMWDIIRQAGLEVQGLDFGHTKSGGRGFVRYGGFNLVKI